MPPEDDNSDQTANTGTTTEDSFESPPANATSVLPIIVGMALVALAALGGVAWFMMTEPANTSIPQIAPATATEIATPANTLGFRGDTRNPSEIIRAARRAQERLDTAASAK